MIDDPRAAAAILGRKGGAARVPKGFARMDRQKGDEARKKSIQTRKRKKREAGK
jgi:hypothetical protein